MKCQQRRTNVCYGNPIIGEIEQAKTFRKHREQLRDIRPAIDNKPPKAQPHLQLYGRDYFAKKRSTTEAAFQDLKMIQSIARTMTRPYTLPSTKGPVSLNANYRKRELFRITMDNHRLLERLENLNPVIDLKKLDAEHKTNQLYMANASYSARKSGNYDTMIAESTRKRRKSAAPSGTGSLPAILREGSNIAPNGTGKHEGSSIKPIKEEEQEEEYEEEFEKDDN